MTAENETPADAPRQTTAYLKRLFAQVGFTIDARRGQNFLVDLNLIDLLVRSAEIGPRDVVLEVGTGTGALTERLAAAAARVVSAEIDPRLAQLARDRLVDRDNVVLVEGDALAAKHRFAPPLLEALAAARSAAADGRFLLAANLPYCVATPVISNLLALPHPFDAAIVTVQREMAERMTAPAGTRSYNALRDHPRAAAERVLAASQGRVGDRAPRPRPRAAGRDRRPRPVSRLRPGRVLPPPQTAPRCVAAHGRRKA
jgi:16S rRNA (adenine1518-N6/adenine1519-N6)-dimethyltransferase